MAMNKTEQAEMKRLMEAATPLFPSYTQPQPLTNEEIKALPTVEVVYKYDSRQKVFVTPVFFVNVYNATINNSNEAVTHGCITSTGINLRQIAATNSRREGGVIVFATELDALQYVRFEVAKIFAARLAGIDLKIAKIAKA